MYRAGSESGDDLIKYMELPLWEAKGCLENVHSRYPLSLKYFASTANRIHVWLYEEVNTNQ